MAAPQLLVVDTAKRLQTAEAVMHTDWCLSFKAQRNGMGILIDTMKQVRGMGSKKVPGLIRFRLEAVKVFCKIKVRS